MKLEERGGVRECGGGVWGGINGFGGGNGGDGWMVVVVEGRRRRRR